MGCIDTPRRSRRAWDTATPVSVRDALMSSVRELSIVSEASSFGDQPQEPLEDATHHRRTPSVAWELPVEDFRPQKPDSKVVSTLRKGNAERPKREKSDAEVTTARKPRRTWANPPDQPERLTGIRARVRGASDNAVKAKKAAMAKHDAKKLLSTSRARQKVIKSRAEDFQKTIRLLEAKSSVFRRSQSPEEFVNISEEEACIMEVQRASFDRWEKAVECAKMAMEEVIEAEKVMGFAAEFDQLKGMMDTHGKEWDVGIDKYIDLYKNLQTAYPETAPIRRSKIHRRQSFPHPNNKKPTPKPRPEVAPFPTRPCDRCPDEKLKAVRASNIPSGTGRNSSSQRFDPSYILSLGRRFAHSAETWFLKLIHSMVGIEVGQSVYCREDCYRLMESLSKLQNWLMTAKGTTRIDRHEVLKNRLRDTIIRWSAHMFELPLARTSV